MSTRISPYNIPKSSTCYTIESTASSDNWKITRYEGLKIGDVIYPASIAERVFSYDSPTSNNTVEIGPLRVTIPRLLNDGTKTGFEYVRSDGSTPQTFGVSDSNKIPWNITIDANRKSTSYNSATPYFDLAHNAKLYDRGEYICKDSLRLRIQTAKPSIFVPNNDEWLGFYIDYDCNYGAPVVDNEYGDETMANFFHADIENVIIDGAITNAKMEDISDYGYDSSVDDRIGKNKYDGTKSKSVGIGYGNNYKNQTSVINNSLSKSRTPRSALELPGFFYFNESLEFDYHVYFSFYFTSKTNYTTFKLHNFRTWFTGNVYVLD